jgi:RNA polymerase subunit RPABC4/transcription elongation factor Spt4
VKECKNCHRLFDNMLYEFTCSPMCHDMYVENCIQNLITILGTDTKIITDSVSGLRYSVPIRDILTKGLKYQDLSKYPLVT